MLALFKLPLGGRIDAIDSSGGAAPPLALNAFPLLAVLLLLRLPDASGRIARAAAIDRSGSLGRKFAPRLARDDSFGFLYCKRRENCSISSLLRCSMI